MGKEVRVATNRYGDCIITGASQVVSNHLATHHYDGPIILKTIDKFDSLPKDFSFVIKRDDEFIYQNTEAQEKCAYINLGGLFLIL